MSEEDRKNDLFTGVLFGKEAEMHRNGLARQTFLWLEQIARATEGRTFEQIRTDFLKQGADEEQLNRLASLMPEEMERKFFAGLSILTDGDPRSWPNWMGALLEEIRQTPVGEMVREILQALKQGIIYFGIAQIKEGPPFSGTVEVEPGKTGLFLAVPLDFNAEELPNSPHLLFFRDS